MRCIPRLGGELLCARKQLRHYHSPDNLSWDEWRLTEKEVERIDLENAATPEEADELEEMNPGTRGGDKLKSKNSLGDKFVSQNDDFTRG